MAVTTTQATGNTGHLDPTRVIEGTLEEYDRFAELIAGIDAAAWRTPTRCEGWQVRHVAAHVVGVATDAVAGGPLRTPEEQADQGADRSPAEQAVELRRCAATLRALSAGLDGDAWTSPSVAPDLTIGQGILTLWYDTYIHADDIRAALGLPTVPSDGLAASVEYLAWQLELLGYGPARLELDGLPPIDVGGSGGPRIGGDPHTFVLVATGRLDPAVLGLDGTVNIYREG